MEKTKYLVLAVITALLLCSLPAYADETNKVAKDSSSPEWLSRTTIQVQPQKDYKPLYIIETVQPLHQTLDKSKTTFVQLRLSNQSDMGTMSTVGFGKRFLSKDKQTVNGINMFYDYGDRHHYQRMSIGGEYFYKNVEMRANIYKGLAGEEYTEGTSTYEKAADGYDCEIGTVIPNIPYAKIFAQGFSWNYKHTDDENGYKIRTELQLTPQVALEAGYIDDNKKNSKYINVSYTLGRTNRVAAFGGVKVKPENNKLEDKVLDMLDNVNRPNNEFKQPVAAPTPAPAQAFQS